jgi:NADH:ubiquinone oxidoreductase subunit 6 (subunit J)
MFLALAFALVGCLYILLNAEYVAVVQIIIYAGAVTVLLLFAIMLTKRTILGEESHESRVSMFYELTSAGFLLWFILLSICAPAFAPETYSVTLDRTIASPYSMHELGMRMFTGYILPFLMVGALLAVAMLAGVFIAREKEED